MVLLVVVFFCVFVVFVIFVFLVVFLNFVKNGILIKGGIYLEKFFELKVIVFDKIGIFIKGKLVVIDSFFFDEKDLV